MKMHKPPKGKTHTLYKPKDRVVSLKSAAWQRLRAQVLAEQPLCEHCYDDGKVTPATDVDHIDNNGDNNARDNLASLCHSCHSIKTHAEMHGRKRRKVGSKKRRMRAKIRHRDRLTVGPARLSLPVLSRPISG